MVGLCFIPFVLKGPEKYELKAFEVYLYLGISSKIFFKQQYDQTKEWHQPLFTIRPWVILGSFWKI